MSGRYFDGEEPARKSRRPQQHRHHSSGGYRWDDQQDAGLLPIDDVAAENVDGLFRSEPEEIGNRPERRPRRRRRGKRLAGWLVALGVLAGLVGVAWYGANELFEFGAEDYAGDGTDDIIVEVADGDTTQAIAETLEESNVVASSRAFVNAAQDNEDVRSIHPGYYAVKTEMSGANAVQALLADDARVGEVQITAGSRLDDTTRPDDETQPGIYEQLAQASCAEIDGEDTCVPADELRSTAADTDLTDLGVPEWLATPAAEADDDHRLEGLVMPGIYDIKPGWDAAEILTEVLSVSASRFEAAGLPDQAERTDHEPYEVVVLASIVESEAVQQDFGKVARVVYNRMDEDMSLEMDSTINYALDRPHIRTSESDRQRQGPYNTYRNDGLPPTPISAPSPEALQAALEPDSGDWLYFVKCEDNGLSCFSADYDEHRRNVADAQDRGVW